MFFLYVNTIWNKAEACSRTGNDWNDRPVHVYFHKRDVGMQGGIGDTYT